jgi:hypothetical protein
MPVIIPGIEHRIRGCFISGLVERADPCRNISEVHLG